MRPPHPLLTIALGLVSLAIIVQATLAGVFIGGAGNTRYLHTKLSWPGRSTSPVQP